MNKMLMSMVAVLLTVLTAGLTSVHVVAAATSNVYIGEVKIFEGSYSKAEEEGFTLLKDEDDKPIDLNKDAGVSGLGAKGDKAVYFGYKTTNLRSEAITDLAVMNMKGGYSIKDYETLMETQMKTQIVPLVNNFLAAIKEYRVNYNAGVQRTVYIHGVLNKYIDDDTGKGLGDLLLNPTKFEMGDEAYDKLSDDEKKNHADILTIIAQANGKAILTMENLITRAADTNDDNWFERFTETTYDDLADSTGLSPNDAKKQLAKDYGDTADKLLDMWEDFRTGLEQYDDHRAYIEAYEQKKIQEIDAKANKINTVNENSSDAEFVDAILSYEESVAAQVELMRALKMVMLHDTLAETETEDGTMLDFFMQTREEIEDDITVLYPLAASLTDGQKAGLEYVSLEELMMIAMTDDGVYSDMQLDTMTPISIYDGVDRGIYEKGAVALTSDALRGDFTEQVEEKNGSLSAWSIAAWAVTGAMALGALTTLGLKFVFKAQGDHLYQHIWGGQNATLSDPERLALMEPHRYYKYLPDDNIKVVWDYDVAWMRSTICKWMSVGFSVALVIMTGVSIYLTVRDMQQRYKVDFTPIPRYIVDEKDITTYNDKGEKIVVQNQSAYYKAVESNRAKGDFRFDEIGTYADMNGCVGRQWLALYTAQNEAMQPILADSFKVVIGKTEVPAGYSTGIHMFGSDAAFNLNSNLYDWNDSAKSVFVYYKTDDSAPSAAGSNFSGGVLALSAVGGLVVGAGLTALIMTLVKKRKGTKTSVTE